MPFVAYHRVPGGDQQLISELDQPLRPAGDADVDITLEDTAEDSFLNLHDSHLPTSRSSSSGSRWYQSSWITSQHLAVRYVWAEAKRSPKSLAIGCFTVLLVVCFVR